MKVKLVLLLSQILEPVLLTCDIEYYLVGGMVQNTYRPEQFASIDQELFTALCQRARAIVGEHYDRQRPVLPCLEG